MKQRQRKKLGKKLCVVLTRLVQNRKYVEEGISFLQAALVKYKTYRRGILKVHRSDSKEANKKIKAIKRKL